MIGQVFARHLSIKKSGFSQVVYLLPGGVILKILGRAVRASAMLLESALGASPRRRLSLNPILQSKGESRSEPTVVACILTKGCKCGINRACAIAVFAARQLPSPGSALAPWS